MMRRKIVGFVGSLSAPSRTRALVEAVICRAAERFDLDGRVLDLGDLPPSLGASGRLSDLAPAARAGIETLFAADALVVASPVYKGSHTGLFKHAFDLIDPSAFADKPVLLAATGGGDCHALVIEHQLRPLFGFFEARTLATGVYASERDFIDGAPASAPLLERIERAVAQFAPYLAAGDPAGRPASAAI